MPKYSARPYEPMPTVRWGVWKELSDGFKLVALIPEGRYARDMAERIASALNRSPK